MPQSSSDYLVYTNGGYREYMGPSTEEKPTSGFYCGIWTETDTGDVYFYDKEQEDWVKQFSFQE